MNASVSVPGRPWPLLVTSPRFIYPVVLALLSMGLAAAFWWQDPTLFSRAGNFIIGAGVWMSLRYTLRDGINRHKTGNQPTEKGKLNPAYFNEIALSIGDARLQIHGFGIVIAGSVVASFGDLLLSATFPSCFA